MDEIIDEELRVVSEDGGEPIDPEESKFNHDLENALGSDKQNVVDKEYAGVTHDPEDIEDEIMNQTGIQE